jgi:hypothetical protein
VAEAPNPAGGVPRKRHQCGVTHNRAGRKAGRHHAGFLTVCVTSRSRVRWTFDVKAKRRLMTGTIASEATYSVAGKRICSASKAWEP